MAEREPPYDAGQAEPLPLTDEDLDWLLRICSEVEERVRESMMEPGWLDCYPAATSLASGPEVVGAPVPWVRRLVAEVRRLRALADTFERQALEDDLRAQPRGEDRPPRLPYFEGKIAAFLHAARSVRGSDESPSDQWDRVRKTAAGTAT